MIPLIALLSALIAFPARPATAAAPAPADQNAAPTKSPLETALEDAASSDSSARRRGVNALGEIRDPKSLPALKKALADEDAFVRGGAADALGRMRAIEAGPEISRLLEKDPHPQVRQQAAIALAYVWVPEALNPLLAALGDAEAGVRYAAARTLGHARAAAAAGRLNEILVADKDSAMRRSAAGALRQLRDPSSADPLRKALADSDASVRREAAQALSDYAGADTEKALRAAGSDADSFVRVHAAQSLAKLAKAGAPEEKSLLGFLADPDARLRSIAANALGEFASAAASKAIEKAEKTEKNPGVRSALHAAVERIKARSGKK